MPQINEEANTLNLLNKSQELTFPNGMLSSQTNSFFRIQ